MILKVVSNSVGTKGWRCGVKRIKADVTLGAGEKLFAGTSISCCATHFDWTIADNLPKFLLPLGVQILSTTSFCNIKCISIMEGN